MKVIVKNNQKDLSFPQTTWKKGLQLLVKETITFEGQSCDEVSIHFVTTEKISQLHDEYFDDPTSTDCISFPLDGPDAIGYCVLGDVFVCPATALEYCAAHGGDPCTETILYVVHGLLHLMGYDDLNDEDRKIMKAAEKRHMKNLVQKKLVI